MFNCRKGLILLSIDLLSALFAIAQQPLNDSLLIAVKNNDLERVKILVEQGADVNYCDSNKAPLLMWAAYKADLKMVKYLVGIGADVKKKGVIPLGRGGWYGNLTGIAAGEGKLDLLKYLIEDCEIDVNDKEIDLTGTSGWNALQYAQNNRYKDIISYIILRDTSLNALKTFSISSLYEMNNDDLVIKMIESNKKDSIAQNISKSLLFLAIESNKTRFIKKLLSYRTDLNCFNEDTLSPLAYALVHNQPEIARVLVENGAPVNQPCYDGKTPLFFAIEINDAILVKYLLSKGANINQQDNLGRTPLFFSILCENESMALLLLSYEADASIATFV